MNSVNDKEGEKILIFCRSHKSIAPRESQQFQFLREVDDGALPVLPRAEGRVAALLATAELRVPVEDVLAASQEVAGLSGVHGLSGGGKHNSFGTHL